LEYKTLIGKSVEEIESGRKRLNFQDRITRKTSSRRLNWEAKACYLSCLTIFFPTIVFTSETWGGAHLFNHGGGDFKKTHRSLKW
jgi:hypothetical protein